MKDDSYIVCYPDRAVTMIRLDVIAILIGYGFYPNEAQHLAAKFEPLVEGWIKNGK